MIPKGLFAYRSTGFRLMFLLILVLFFGSLTQMIGLMLTSGSGSVSLQDVVGEDGLQALRWVREYPQDPPGFVCLGRVHPGSLGLCLCHLWAH